MASERFQNGEIDTSGRCVDGTASCRRAVDKVEHTITAFYRVVLCVQTVHAHEVQQREILDVFRSIGKVTGGDAVFVTQIEDIQHEVPRCNLISFDVVNVLHHEVPHRHLGVDGGALQHLGYKHVRLLDTLV